MNSGELVRLHISEAVVSAQKKIAYTEKCVVELTLEILHVFFADLPLIQIHF